jgi:hypothetical protein
MERTMVLRERVDYCPVVHGGCGEPLEWMPRPAVTDAGENSVYLQTTCGSCGHVWSLPPGVGIDR